MEPEILLNVCRMPATVPIRPSIGNHSAACARLVSHRSGRSSKPVPRHCSDRHARQQLNDEQRPAQAED